MDLILIRHVETQNNKSGGYMGRSIDTPTTPEGARRFKCTLQAFRERVPIPKDAVTLCSPSLRCKQTLEIVNDTLGLPHSIIVASEFAETDYGDFEGKDADDIKRQYPNLIKTWLHKPAQMRFPNGESYVEVQRRAIRKIRELEVAWPDKMVLVCTHVDVIKMILCALLDISINMKVFFDISNGSFTYITSTYRGLTVKTLNFV